MSWLRDGLESREPFHELEDLQVRGLVHVEKRELLNCGTPEQQAYGHYCEGWAEPGDPYGEAVGCESCGRLLEDSEPEAVYTLTVDHKAVVAELQGMLDGRRLREGVAWSVEGDQDDVLVVVADWSDDTRWMSNRVLCGRPFVLVQVDEVVTASRLGSGDWVVAVSLLDVLRETTVLGGAIQRAQEMSGLPRSEDAVVELHRLRSAVVQVPRGAHLVELRDRELRVDDVVVEIPAGMHKVVAWLIDRHSEDVRDGKAPEAFCMWSLADMSEALGVPRTTVHKQLRRFEHRLADRYAEEVNSPLSEGGVIQREDSAWRFSPDCLVRRVA